MQYPKLIESKTSDNEVYAIEWNPGMDLLATVFKNGALTCSRLLSLQKVWHKQLHGRIDSIAWRPDGRILAIGGYNDHVKEYVCTLHDVENGKKVHSITKKRAITSVAWYEDKYKVDDFLISSKKNGLKIAMANENFSHQLALEQTQLNILTIATEDGLISFYALGLFYLGTVFLPADRNSKIVKTHMSNCLRYLTAVLHTKFSNYATISLRVIRIETFQNRSNEILRVSKMYAKITDELEYLDDTIAAINHNWADVLAGLDSKLSSYCSRKNANPNESRNGYTFLSADELLQLLVIGFPSDNLEKFLTDMSDKGLKKLNNAIEQTCLRVQNLIVKNAQKCCYHLHGDLNHLRGMALWREKYEEIGLDDKYIVQAMRAVGSLMLKLTELQQVIDHSLKSTKSFFRWLISIACRMTGEQNNSAIPNDVNKTTQQDIQLITDFILENFDYNTNQDDIDVVSSGTSQPVQGADGESGVFSNRPTCSNFTLEQVGQYLKFEPLSRQKYSFIKPNSNFWIEFFKSRPEFTESNRLGEDGSNILLLYPHNPDTSLLQEHKNTCKSVEAAFDAVAENMRSSLIYHSVGLIFLRDMIRNGPTGRIRIETDVKSQKHYTLFQLKQEPVYKQYLAAQSLDDLSFHLVSIEFSTLNSPAIVPGGISTGGSNKKGRHGVKLNITDSSFYENKETKRMLISFLLLDNHCGDTLIVQVELNKFLDTKHTQMLSVFQSDRVFKTHDSIDSYADKIAIKLDIYTDPAYERKHLFNGKMEESIVVKKIKSTVGRDMFCSSGRGVIAFTSCGNKRLHLYELESTVGSLDIMDDEVDGDEKADESLIDTDMLS